MKTKPSLTLLLITFSALLVISASRDLNREETTRVGDAEKQYERCQTTCRGTGMEQWQCQRRCQDAYEAALKRERWEHEHEQKYHGGGEEEHHGDAGERHPRKGDYRACMKRCEDKEEGFARQRQCKLHCEERYGRGEHSRRHSGEGGRSRREDNSHPKSKEKKEAKNPYYFDSKSFETLYSTGEGSLKVLQRFSEKSNLLLGIDRFRVGFYEANPNTFMLPHHWDADSVIFVTQGKAVLTFTTQNNRETFNLERGDVMIIPAGTTSYLVNSDNTEKLQIAELIHPVNTPGHYEQYFGVGREESESYFNGFSTDILQAALDVPRDQLESLFKQQKGGAIVKARREQVKALAQRGISTRRFGEYRGRFFPFNLLDERPEFFNDHGRFYEVSPNEYKLLQDLDVSVAYCDIKQGSMMAPNFNSRTTYILIVEEGSGYFEMACPHLDSESNKGKQGSSPLYEKVRSPLTQGDVLVIPAGHPIALVASGNENLKTIGFGVNAQNNQRNFLAGQDNMINQLDSEAMELSFKMPARDVKEMFQRQRNSYFMVGPQQQQNALVSSLDFAGF